MAYGSIAESKTIRVNSTQSYDVKEIEMGKVKRMVSVDFRFDGGEWEEFFRILAQHGVPYNEVLFYAGGALDRNKCAVKYGGGFRMSIAFPRHRSAIRKFFKTGENDPRVALLKRALKLPFKSEDDELRMFINGKSITDFFTLHAPAPKEGYEADEDWVEVGG